jgi:Conjugal transfer protein
MKHLIIACSTVLQFFFFSCPGIAQVKSVYPKQDEIILVRTGLGIATIVQVPQAIQSAVIGDQSGFKVEYLDKAVTIKPLRYGARTNLYLVTNAVRYTLKLSTVDQNGADYIVYVKERATPQNVYRNFAKSAVGKTLTLRMERVGQTNDGLILLEGAVYSKTQKRIRPDEFWIYQDGKSRPAHSLYLSGTTVDDQHPVKLGVAIAKSDLAANRPIRFEIKSSESVAVVFPSEVLWK